MKTYEIINLNTNEKLGEVEASNIVNAEYKACGIWPNVPSQLIAAFTPERMAFTSPQMKCKEEVYEYERDCLCY